jgi:hypothetical protein
MQSQFFSRILKRKLKDSIIFLHRTSNIEIIQKMKKEILIIKHRIRVYKKQFKNDN